MPYVGRGLTTGAQYQKLDAIAINNATTFTMSVGSVNVSPDQNHLILVVNGVIQEPGTGFTVAGSTCTLASAITTSGHSGTDTIYGVIAGDAAFAAYDSIGANALGVTAGTVTASRAIVPDSNKDIASFRNVTLTGELDAATLDISGNADIDGTTNLDAVDIDGAVQVDNTITVGADDQGYDVKFFGDTASAYMLWDTSADDLVFAGAAGIDLAGDLDVDGTTNLDAVDIDGAVNMAADLTMGANILMADDTSIGISDSDERIEFDASGDISVLGANFGIGTTSPVQKLTIEGDTTNAGDGTEGQLVVRGSTDSNIKMMIGVDTTSKVGFISPMDHGTAWEDLALCSNGGNVGIGTTSPGAKLQINGVSGTNPVTIIKGAVIDTVSEFMRVGRSDSDVRYHSIKTVNSDTEANNYISFEIHDASGTTATTEVIRLRGDGNVGIGTSSPGGKLHIQSASKISNAVDSAGDELILENSTDTGMTIISNNDGACTIYFGDQDDANNGYIQYNNSGPKLEFGVGGNTNVAHFNSDGNLLLNKELHIYDRDGGGSTFARIRYDNSDNELRIEANEVSGDDIAIKAHDAIYFQDAGGTKMTLDGGHLGIGTGSLNGVLNVYMDSSEKYVAEFMHDGGSVDRWGIMVQAGHDTETGSNYFFIAKDGDGGVTGYLKTVSGTFQLSDTSDIRLKENIKDTTLKGIETIDKIKVRDYNWKKNKDNVVIGGFIANELQEVYPQAVDGKPDAVDKDGKIEPMTVSRDVLVPLLVKATQELSQQNDDLKKRIEALEAK